MVSRVGYTFLYDQMVASKAAFGAETSGHVYFRVSDTYYTESAAYALASLLRFLAQEGRALSALVDPLRSRYVQSPEINVEVKDKDRAMREIERRYAGGKIDRLDGISVEFRRTTGSTFGRATPSRSFGFVWRARRAGGGGSHPEIRGASEQ